jgi:hypothetical protein
MRKKKKRKKRLAYPSEAPKNDKKMWKRRLTRVFQTTEHQIDEMFVLECQKIFRIDKVDRNVISAFQSSSERPNVATILQCGNQ